MWKNLGFVCSCGLAAALLAGQARGEPPIGQIAQYRQFVTGTLLTLYLLQEKSKIGIRQLLKPITLQC
jgi:hypothetical protein